MVCPNCKAVVGEHQAHRCTNAIDVSQLAENEARTRACDHFDRHVGIAHPTIGDGFVVCNLCGALLGDDGVTWEAPLWWRPPPSPIPFAGSTRSKPLQLDSEAAANAMSGPPSLYVREARRVARELLADADPGTLPFNVCLLWRLAELVEAADPELGKKAGA